MKRIVLFTLMAMGSAYAMQQPQQVIYQPRIVFCPVSFNGQTIMIPKVVQVPVFIQLPTPMEMQQANQQPAETHNRLAMLADAAHKLNQEPHKRGREENGAETDDQQPSKKQKIDDEEKQNGANAEENASNDQGEPNQSWVEALIDYSTKSCRQCGKSLAETKNQTWRQRLQRHIMKSHHANAKGKRRVAKPDEGGPFHCPKCNKGWKKEQSMKVHLTSCKVRNVGKRKKKKQFE